MKTVDKALSVLDQFSLDHTEIGLSELARMADLDKAATRRLLVAMEKHGFIEQHQQTRKYRLGHGFLRLARIREATVPLAKAAQEVSDWLVNQTGETAHVAVPTAHGMATVAHRLPRRGHVVTVEPAQILLFHATASGLAFMAFASDSRKEAALTQRREKITEATLTSKTDVLQAIKKTRHQGFARTTDTFETGVASIAIPFFADAVDPAGTVALALPRADLTDQRCTDLLPVLQQAVSQIEIALRGL